MFEPPCIFQRKNFKKHAIYILIVNNLKILITTNLFHRIQFLLFFNNRFVSKMIFSRDKTLAITALYNMQDLNEWNSKHKCVNINVNQWSIP